jgi:hypothetical protein
VLLGLFGSLPQTPSAFETQMCAPHLHLKRQLLRFTSRVTLQAAPEDSNKYGTSGTRFTADHKGIVDIFTPKHHLRSPAAYMRRVTALKATFAVNYSGCFAVYSYSVSWGASSHQFFVFLSQRRELFQPCTSTGPFNNSKQQRLWTSKDCIMNGGFHLELKS